MIPIIPVANDLADEATLLCFDEFTVTDIADAMLLGRLFAQLFARGVVVVCTSNVVPQELYKGGLNRSLFLPFIDLIQSRMEVVKLASRTDFRLEKLSGQPVWITPIDEASDNAMNSRLGKADRRGGAARGAHRPRAMNSSCRSRPMAWPVSPSRNCANCRSADRTIWPLPAPITR